MKKVQALAALCGTLLAPPALAQVGGESSGGQAAPSGVDEGMPFPEPGGEGSYLDPEPPAAGTEGALGDDVTLGDDGSLGSVGDDFSDEASSFDSRGEVAFEGRAFLPDDDDSTDDAAAGLFTRLEWSHERGPWQQRARVFGRIDVIDEERDRIVVEEAWAQYWKGALKLRIGADIVNWTATEAFHPADVINARNLDSDIENYEKLGEPMVQVALSLPTNTSFELYAMPAYMSPILPSPRSRLSPVPEGAVAGERLMVDRDGRFTNDTFGPQGAVRIRQVIGGADIALHALEHMDRIQPVVVPEPGTNRVHAVFRTVRQLGATYSQVIGGFIGKLELAHRDFARLLETEPLGPIPERDHTTVAVGFEYGWVHDAGSESTILLEGQSVFGLSRAARAEVNPFQRDVLVGYRFAWNDEDSKELRLSAIIDVENPDEYLINASYRQRLGETWGVELGARLFNASYDGSSPWGLVPLRDADMVRLVLTRYF